VYDRRRLREILLSAYSGKRDGEIVRIYRRGRIVGHVHEDGEVHWIRNEGGGLLLTDVIRVREARRGKLRQRKMLDMGGEVARLLVCDKP